MKPIAVLAKVVRSPTAVSTVAISPIFRMMIGRTSRPLVAE